MRIWDSSPFALSFLVNELRPHKHLSIYPEPLPTNGAYLLKEHAGGAVPSAPRAGDQAGCPQ